MRMQKATYTIFNPLTLSFLIEKIRYYRIVFSVTTACTITIVYRLLNVEFSWLPIIAAIAALQYAYAIDNILDRKDPSVKICAGSHMSLYAVVICASVIMMGVVVFVPKLIIFAVVMFIFFSIYNAEFQMFSIKRIPYLKSPYMAFCFCLFSVALPAVYFECLVSVTTGLISTIFFFIMVAQSMCQDIRDIDSDRSNNFHTFPVIHGPTLTYFVAHILLFLAALLSAMLGNLGLIVYIFFISLILVSFQVSEKIYEALKTVSGPILIVLGHLFS